MRKKLILLTRTATWLRSARWVRLCLWHRTSPGIFTSTASAGALWKTSLICTEMSYCWEVKGEQTGWQECAECLQNKPDSCRWKELNVTWTFSVSAEARVDKTGVRSWWQESMDLTVPTCFPTTSAVLLPKNSKSQSIWLPLCSAHIRARKMSHSQTATSCERNALPEERGKTLSCCCHC